MPRLQLGVSCRHLRRSRPAFLVDAARSPGGSHIVYSTSTGLGQGSDTWLVNSDGGQQTHLFSTASGAQSIVGLFTWSPNGTSIAYERISDSPIPFLPAGLWVMNNSGGTQRFLATADGGHGYAPVWSPDGTHIAFVERINLSDRRDAAKQHGKGQFDTEEHRQLHVACQWNGGSASHLSLARRQNHVVLSSNPVALPQDVSPKMPCTKDTLCNTMLAWHVQSMGVMEDG